jgi:integrase
VILTVARTGEVIGARWGEIDKADKFWTVPPGRIKAEKAHRVPLSERALTILDEVKLICGVGNGHDKAESFVFPGDKSGQPLSKMVFLRLLRRMNRSDVTTHGFRATFRDWAAEHTNFPNEVAEMALAHTISSKVEQAYRRGDLFERRRRMMASWSTFCTTLKKALRNNVTTARKKDNLRRLSSGRAEGLPPHSPVSRFGTNLQ